MPGLVSRCVLLIALALVIVCVGGCAEDRPNRIASSRACIYSGSSLSDLAAFERLVGRHFACALVYDAGQPTWSSWEDPWFISNRIPDENWVHFARQKGNELVITVEMLPDEARSQDWRALGAEGTYSSHARTLAKNLIANGMGRAVVRLGSEPNGTWAPDGVGSTRRDWTLWRQFWRRTVLAMRSVPGARFDFNWCIANGYRAIPFSDYYPGNRFVDSIGVDVYDQREPSSTGGSWSYLRSRPGGVAAIVAFAKAHHKPLSIPEWGLVPAADGGGGDDLQFVTGIRDLLSHNDVSFESYFFADSSATALERSPRSLALYREMIGEG